LNINEKKPYKKEVYVKDSADTNKEKEKVKSKKIDIINIDDVFLIDKG